jgi:hypothetical protein
MEGKDGAGKRRSKWYPRRTERHLILVLCSNAMLLHRLIVWKKASQTSFASWNLGSSYLGGGRAINQTLATTSTAHTMSKPVLANDGARHQAR